jgi:hypothetical protein
MDRRAAFFLVAALIATVLVPVTDAGDRWVPIAVAITYLLLAIASWADRRTRRAEHHRSAPPV